MNHQDISELDALQRARKYCSYQERCQSEVRNMLVGKGISRKIIEGVISNLIEENYLNELRFAKVFAGGKFRIKNWGRIKIRMKLIEKRISKQCISQGMKEINDQDYNSTLKKLIAARWEGTKKIDTIDKASMMRYLRSKGYEDDLIYKEMNRYVK